MISNVCSPATNDLAAAYDWLREQQLEDAARTVAAGEVDIQDLAVLDSGADQDDDDDFEGHDLQEPSGDSAGLVRERVAYAMKYLDPVISRYDNGYRFPMALYATIEREDAELALLGRYYGSVCSQQSMRQPHDRKTRRRYY